MDAGHASDSDVLADAAYNAANVQAIVVFTATGYTG
jgi:hypothetical protein